MYVVLAVCRYDHVVACMLMEPAMRDIRSVW